MKNALSEQITGPSENIENKVIDINSILTRNKVKELLRASFTARPVTTAELYELSKGEFDPLNPTYNTERVAEKYGPDGPNALKNRDEKRIFNLTSQKVDLLGTEDGKPVRYNFAVLMDGRVMIGKFYEGESDDGVKHFQLANGADTKITGQIYVKNGQKYVNNNSATFRYMLFQNYRNFYQNPETGSFVTHADRDNQEMLKQVFQAVLDKSVQIGPDYKEGDVIEDFISRIEEKIAKGMELDEEVLKKYEFLKKWPNLTKADHHLVSDEDWKALSQKSQVA